MTRRKTKQGRGGQHGPHINAAQPISQAAKARQKRRMRAGKPIKL